jgi:hypothetical protein
MPDRSINLKVSELWTSSQRQSTTKEEGRKCQDCATTSPESAFPCLREAPRQLEGLLPSLVQQKRMKQDGTVEEWRVKDTKGTVKADCTRAFFYSLRSHQGYQQRTAHSFIHSWSNGKITEFPFLFFQLSSIRCTANQIFIYSIFVSTLFPPGNLSSGSISHLSTCDFG